MKNLYEYVKELAIKIDCLRKDFEYYKKHHKDHSSSGSGSGTTVIFNGELWGGEHSSMKAYTKNTQVKVIDGDIVNIYIAKRNVPAYINITDINYWEYQYTTIIDGSVLDAFKTTTIIATTPPVGIAPEGTEWVMYKE